MVKSHLVPALLATLSYVQASPAPPRGCKGGRCGTKEPRLGAVACEVDTCSKIGTDLLRDGGNAVDAMVGTVFCVGTVAMYHSGIGGGGFMTLRTSNGTYQTIDFRETAPAAAYEDMYKDNEDASIYGGLASGVPGEIRGLEYIHSRYGDLPWADVIAPSIKLARYGFPVTDDLLMYIAKTEPNDFLTHDPAWALDFAPNGTLVEAGDIMTRKRYANTLEAIAQEGPDAFYKGAIASATIRALRADGGTMTLNDLEKYQVEVREPVQIEYRGHKLTTMNAPSGGIVALSTLNTLKGYEDFGAAENFNLSTHRLDEALRFAYAQRSELGDPSYVDGLTEFTRDMISPELGKEIRSKIVDDKTFPLEYYNPKGLESIETPGTSHIVTADGSGMSVSLTTTINLYFGSQLMVPETGVIMNNEMNDFSIPGVENAFGYLPSPSNFVRPGKRPLSSITPFIVESPEGELFASIGAAGGSRIITSTVQNLIHIIDRGLAVKEALAQPRLHDQLSPTQISFEYSYDNSTVAYLKGLGANVTWVAPGQSSAQGIVRLPSGVFQAAGEPRQKNSGGIAV
ncbi:Gamma-glutamyltranspeptidase-like protein [Hapsidospora chrysogenum ATCC 11550]|uniref:Glutathione hydrolase n=1 Tax=Hapsidospora chrysogenum (strain ATCC 11550 / CBS 779.69 / DSM 880 / IAM 14645 / JCM 23072 / IMI 49137) TaxID=857340 RepID=A0A086SY22_HAPC1|nr:Gamma-glutamyltranspeptidase-like protein [Hapsidospora chrysogenum ATCC 11550]